MRRTLLIATLFAAACASSPGSRPRLGVGVIEAGSYGSGASVLGEHVYTIQITNHSTDAVTIQSIHLDVTGTEFRMEGADATIGAPIGPDETQEFEVNGYISSMSNRSTRIMLDRVNALVVTISGTGPAGNFTDSGTYSISNRQ